MDQPGLDPALHRHALEGLSRINVFSGSARIVWRSVYRLMKANPGRRLRLLDIATGGGDVPIRLWQRAQRAGCDLEIHAADISDTALDLARRRAVRVGADVNFFRLDALNDDWPGDFDVVTSSLFLHHLDDAAARSFLEKMKGAARELAVVNDLVRSRLGYAVAWLGTRLLTRSNVVHVDGPMSVAAAFSLTEVRALAERAGWDGATLAWRWPWRYLLEWSRTR